MGTGDNPAFTEGPTLGIWGANELPNSCTLEEGSSYYDYDYRSNGESGSGSGSGDDYNYDYDYEAPMVIPDGTCSANTEAALQTDECKTLLANQPTIIKNTLELLIQYSCKTDVYESLPISQGLRKGRKKRRNRNKSKGRLAPISTVNLTADIKTELNFENTRHRYPWICSLRTRGMNPEHLCAVNLLAVPPNPTVIVGSAHCTYLCKDTDANGRRLDPCCCVKAEEGQESCSDDKVKCGNDPRGVEMDGRDAEILCGEWQSGVYSQTTSGEEYNVVLPIEKIIRSPNFDAEILGPEGGSDIAVFKVNDDQLQDSRKNRIYPACLPPKDRKTPTEGVHSGWTKPPTVAFIERFAIGYSGTYGDFYKQWHYKMNISEKCADTTTMQAFGQAVQQPAETYYPPATVCAKDITIQSCFSTGDSGSPLMVREEARPMRYFIEGILSFVKGCEQFVFGDRGGT